MAEKSALDYLKEGYEKIERQQKENEQKIEANEVKAGEIENPLFLMSWGFKERSESEKKEEDEPTDE